MDDMILRLFALYAVAAALAILLVIAYALIRRRYPGRARGLVVMLSLVLFVVSLLAVGWQWRQAQAFTQERERQKAQLAQGLGVDPRQWLRPVVFPLGYFWSVLTKGMPRAEVHGIVHGHERVLRCGSSEDAYKSEVYYFFSNRRSDALRMQVRYLDDRVAGLQGDDNSNSIYDESCVPGQWEDEAE